MITVHHLNNSRSQRVLWLLEELGVPYEIQKYQRDAKTMLAPPELLKVHPLGKSPVITDDGVTVAESGAIIEYLLERYGAGRLEPEKGTPARALRALLRLSSSLPLATPGMSAWVPIGRCGVDSAAASGAALASIRIVPSVPR